MYFQSNSILIFKVSEKNQYIFYELYVKMHISELGRIVLNMSMFYFCYFHYEKVSNAIYGLTYIIFTFHLFRKIYS